MNFIPVVEGSVVAQLQLIKLRQYIEAIAIQVITAACWQEIYQITHAQPL